ncbi:MAG: GDSL-type esterase/lipase family protein [Oscillospiraceae bacterium]
MSKNKFNIKDFKKLPENQKKAIFTLLGSILAFIIVIIAASALIFNIDKGEDASSLPASGSDSKIVGNDSTYNKADGLLKLDKLKGTVLEAGKDAGDEYLTDTLFIGDSNMERLVNFEQIKLDNFAGKTGMGISSFNTEACVYFEDDSKAYTIAKAVAKMKPRRVIMTFGTNDAGGETTPKAFVDMYKNAITSIQKSYPHCDIIVNTIPPVAKKRTYNNISMQTIDAFNIALADMAKEMGIKLLNSNEILRGEDGFGKKDYFATEDGIHMNETGAKEFIKYVRTHAYEGKDTRPDTKNIPKRRKAPAATSSSQASPSNTSSSKAPIKYATVNYRVKVENGKALGTLKGEGFSDETQRAFTYSKDITSFTITAVPAEGYLFSKWSDGNTEPTRTDANVKESFSVTANFTKKADPVTIKLDQGNITIEEGKEFTVKAIVSGQVDAKNVAWKMDNVHVHIGESYTALLSVGEHTVEAFIEGAPAPVNIKVVVSKKVLPVTVKISGPTETTVGKPVSFTATVENGDSANVSWSLGGTPVGTGATYMFPAQTDGTFTIVATINGTSTATVPIVVKPVPPAPPVSSSTPNPTSDSTPKP